MIDCRPVAIVKSHISDMIGVCFIVQVTKLEFQCLTFNFLALPTRENWTFWSLKNTPLQRGPPGGIESRFPMKKLAISRNPVKKIDFPDSKFSSSLSPQVFCSRLGDLFKRVTIKQLYRKNCTRIQFGSTRGILDPKISWKNGICVYQISPALFFSISPDYFIFFPFTDSKN